LHRIRSERHQPKPTTNESDKDAEILLFVLLPLLTADIEYSIVIYKSAETNNGSSAGIQATSVATNSAGC
jgi:hypothetical protein